MNLEEIKRKKLTEMMQQNEALDEEELRLARQIKQVEALAKSKLTKGALERYNNLRMVYPERAVQAAALIVQSSADVVDDDGLRKLLQMMDSKKKETKIRR